MLNAKETIEEYRARGYGMDGLRAVAEGHPEPLRSQMLTLLEHEDAGKPAAGDEMVYFIAPGEEVEEVGGDIIDFDIMAAHQSVSNGGEVFGHTALNPDDLSVVDAVAVEYSTDPEDIEVEIPVTPGFQNAFLEDSEDIIAMTDADSQELSGDANDETEDKTSQTVYPTDAFSVGEENSSDFNDYLPDLTESVDFLAHDVMPRNDSLAEAASAFSPTSGLEKQPENLYQAGDNTLVGAESRDVTGPVSEDYFPTLPQEAALSQDTPALDHGNSLIQPEVANWGLGNDASSIGLVSLGSTASGVASPPAAYFTAPAAPVLDSDRSEYKPDKASVDSLPEPADDALNDESPTATLECLTEAYTAHEVYHGPNEVKIPNDAEWDKLVEEMESLGVKEELAAIDAEEPLTESSVSDLENSESVEDSYPEASDIVSEEAEVGDLLTLTANKASDNSLPESLADILDNLVPMAEEASPEMEDEVELAGQGASDSQADALTEPAATLEDSVETSLPESLAVELDSLGLASEEAPHGIEDAEELAGESASESQADALTEPAATLEDSEEAPLPESLEEEADSLVPMAEEASPEMEDEEELASDSQADALAEPAATLEDSVEAPLPESLEEEADSLAPMAEEAPPEMEDEEELAGESASDRQADALTEPAATLEESVEASLPESLEEDADSLAPTAEEAPPEMGDGVELAGESASDGQADDLPVPAAVLEDVVDASLPEPLADELDSLTLAAEESELFPADLEETGQEEGDEIVSPDVSENNESVAMEDEEDLDPRPVLKDDLMPRSLSQDNPEQDAWDGEGYDNSDNDVLELTAKANPEETKSALSVQEMEFMGDYLEREREQDNSDNDSTEQSASPLADSGFIFNSWTNSAGFDNDDMGEPLSVNQDADREDGGETSSKSQENDGETSADTEKTAEAEVVSDEDTPDSSSPTQGNKMLVLSADTNFDINDDYLPDETANIIRLPDHLAFKDEEDQDLADDSFLDSEDDVLSGMDGHVNNQGGLRLLESQDNSYGLESADREEVAEAGSAPLSAMTCLSLLRAFSGEAGEDISEENDTLDNANEVVLLQPTEPERDYAAELTAAQHDYQARLDEFSQRLLGLQMAVGESAKLVQKREAELADRDASLAEYAQKVATQEELVRGMNSELAAKVEEIGAKNNELKQMNDLKAEHEGLYHSYEDLRKAFNEMVSDVMPGLQKERDDLTLIVEHQAEDEVKLQSELRRSGRRQAVGYSLAAASILLTVIIPLAHWLGAGDGDQDFALARQDVTEMKSRLEKAEWRNVEAEKTIFNLEHQNNLAKIELAKQEKANRELVTDKRGVELSRRGSIGNGAAAQTVLTAGEEQSLAGPVIAGRPVQRNNVRDADGSIQQVLAANREYYADEDMAVLAANSRINESRAPAAPSRGRAGIAVSSVVRRQEQASRQESGERPSGVQVANVKAGEGVAQVVYRVLNTWDPQVVAWVIRENKIKKDKRGNPMIYPNQQLRLPASNPAAMNTASRGRR
ncbi:MAG: hypothetical protein LBU79_01445 [Planctomycetota bacterium]|nr:hypothetical protein [Planctomycetota bacterium]